MAQCATPAGGKFGYHRAAQSSKQGFSRLGKATAAAVGDGCSGQPQ